MSTSAEEKIKGRPSLSLLAIISFIVSFLASRAITILSPHTMLKIAGYHIHHFWYGFALLAIGGWLGIRYKSDRIDRVAAILYGAGGGIYGDEVGLILTGKDYWTGITYTLVIIFLTIVLLVTFLFRYSRVIAADFAGLTRRKAGLYFGVILAAVSLAVLMRTRSIVVIAFSGSLTIISFLIIVGCVVQLLRKKP